MKEPAMAAGVVGSALVLFVVYGWLSEEQASAWGGLLLALLPLLQALWTRSKVMPVATIERAGLAPEIVKEMAKMPPAPETHELHNTRWERE